MTLDRLLSSSPDEQVIRARSIAKLDDSSATALQSPESTSNGASDLPDILTPPKTPLRPSKRSHRKRLLLSPAGSSTSSSPAASPQKSKSKRQKQNRQKVTPLQKELAALTQGQLVDMIDTLVDLHPDLEQEVRDNIPTPSLEPLEKQLELLLRNIMKSFPWTKWGSNRDAFCYRRVCTHLTAFKKACLDQGRAMINCGAWKTNLEYVLMAWGYVESSPDWDNPAHNNSKRQCFKGLSSQCMTSLKKSKLTVQEYTDIRTRLRQAVAVSDEIGPCVVKLEEILNKLS